MELYRFLSGVDQNLTSMYLNEAKKMEGRLWPPFSLKGFCYGAPLCEFTKEWIEGFEGFYEFFQNYDKLGVVDKIFKGEKKRYLGWGGYTSRGIVCSFSCCPKSHTSNFCTSKRTEYFNVCTPLE